MEHIPEVQLPQIFEDIYTRAERFVFLGIATAPAKAILSNGENAHCTIENIGWWVEMIEKHAPKQVYTHVKTWGNSNGYKILWEESYLEWFIEEGINL